MSVSRSVLRAAGLAAAVALGVSAAPGVYAEGLYGFFIFVMTAVG